jgi:general stress protein YciG
MAKSGTSRRGFASMTKDRVKQVASKGGKKTALSHDMAMIGKAGGQVTAKRGSNYFAKIGRLGGKAGRRGKAAA